MSRLSLRFALAAAVIAALTLAPRAAQAQSTIDRLTAEIERMAGNAQMQKKSQRDGGLAQGEAQELLIDIASSADVMIVGICDNDCSDLDLRVSKDGTMLGEDILDDDNPLVRLQSFGGGQVRVRVEMPACSAAPCGFRVLVFAK